MHNFKQLKVWQDSKALCKEIYLVTSKFPESEKFGLINQIRRSAVSIPSNIAEGSGRITNKDFAKYISYSIGSSFE